MTHTLTDTDALGALRNRNKLIRTVRAKLKGSGLEIRELANAPVISHPGHPEYGRIYITYTAGEVTYRRTVWDYLGPLDNRGTTGHNEEAVVDVQTIIIMLSAPRTSL